MLLDKQNLFSDDQAVTTTAASTNVIDLGADGSGVPSPNEKDIDIFAQVTVDFATLTNVKVSVQTDDNASFNSATTLYSTEAIAAASLVAGYKFMIPKLPKTGVERYIRLYYTTTGTTGTAGKITAGVAIDEQTNR